MNPVSSEFEQYRISKFGEPYLYSVNRQAFEKNSAKIIFDNLYNDKLWDEDYMYIILGCDSGLLVDYVLEHGLAKGSRYLFVESEHVINNLKEQLTFTKWDDRVVLATMEEWETKASELKLQAFMYTDKVRYIQSIAAQDGFDDYYYQAHTELSLKLETKQHYTMISLYRSPFVIKQIINLTENINPISALKNKFTGMDCIILGGGPSLDEVIEQIKGLDDNVVIMAVSRIAKKLLAENITPHFIVSVDPHDVSFDVSKEMLEFSDHSIFINSTYVVPTLLGQWRGISFHDGLRVPWPSKLSKENIILSGPTVTNASISAATELGFKRIFLSGVDLCYARDGNTHAKGSNEAKVGPVLGKREQWITTYNGELAETMMAFIHAIRTITSQAETAIKNECQIYNLSPNAAKIDNIPLANFDAVGRDSSNKVSAIINNIKENFGKVDLIQYTEVTNDIDRLLTELDEIKVIVEQAIEDNKALYKTYSSEQINAQIKENIDLAEEKLSTTYEDTATFLKKYGIHRFIQIARTDGDEEWSDEEMEKVGHKYYQCFLDNIAELTPLLKAAKEKITLRIKEHSPQKDYSPLLKQWRSEKQFGRAYMWKLNNAEKYLTLSSKNKKEFDAQIHEYFDVLHNEDTYHLQRTKEQSSLDGVNRKAVFMYKTKNIDGLKLLINNLNKLGREDINNIINLCSGYHALLNNQPMQALAFFKAIDDEELSQDELIQISVLEIDHQDYLAAEKSLARLSELSIDFAANYAVILRLNGKHQEAIGTYHHILESNPNDLKSWLALAKIHKDLGDTEAAKNAIAAASQLDQDNIEINHLLQGIED